MKSTFVREQKRYTQQELSKMFDCPESKTIMIIRKLKEYGVLKAVKASDVQRELSDLMDDDIEIADVDINENSYLYVFTFVGIIVVAGRILKCYPKYLLNNSNPVSELKQVINVLEKYNSKEQIVRMFNNTNEGQNFNLLAVLLFLLNDYYENGLYVNNRDVVESNGTGEILWDKTINETFTWLSNDRPYYVDLQTRKHVADDYNYFKRLHECILTCASKELKSADLLELFDITEVDLSDEILEDFGDKDYILYRIERELNVEFNTRKQIVLKTIYAYVERSSHLSDIDCLSMFGTNSFNLVWEDVCAQILDNKLDTKLGALKLPVNLVDVYDTKMRLKDIIEKPFWSASGKTAKDTLIPDLISISGQDFIIFDAKYYNAILVEGIQPKGQPGIESVTKQYLYQLAYQKFINDHKFESVMNCFVMPTERTSVIEDGEVSMDMLNNLGLESIKVRRIPAAVAFDLYLSGRKYDIKELHLEN